MGVPPPPRFALAPPLCGLPLVSFPAPPNPACCPALPLCAGSGTGRQRHSHARPRRCIPFLDLKSQISDDRSAPFYLFCLPAAGTFLRHASPAEGRCGGARGQRGWDRGAQGKGCLCASHAPLRAASLFAPRYAALRCLPASLTASPAPGPASTNSHHTTKHNAMHPGVRRGAPGADAGEHNARPGQGPTGQHPGVAAALPRRRRGALISGASPSLSLSRKPPAGQREGKASCALSDCSITRSLDGLFDRVRIVRLQVHGLYNFLFDQRLSADSAADIPQIVAPGPFLGATLRRGQKGPHSVAHSAFCVPFSQPLVSSQIDSRPRAQRALTARRLAWSLAV